VIEGESYNITASFVTDIGERSQVVGNGQGGFLIIRGCYMEVYW